MKETVKSYAVLTGDLYGSSKLSRKEMSEARAALRKAVGAVARSGWGGRGASLVRGELEFFRGDAWQCVLTEPKWALRAAIVIRASMPAAAAKVDTRISIGIGSIESGAQMQASQARGIAFTRSGHGLDERMGSRFGLAIVVPEEWSPIIAGWLETGVRLCDAIVRRLGERQREVVRELCLHPEAPQAEVGGMLSPPITQQAVGKAARSAGWYGLEDAIERFERMDWKQPL